LLSKSTGMMITPIQDSPAIPTEDSNGGATDPCACQSDEFAALLFATLTLPPMGKIIGTEVEVSPDETAAPVMNVIRTNSPVARAGEPGIAVTDASATAAPPEILAAAETDQTATSLVPNAWTTIGDGQPIAADDLVELTPSLAAMSHDDADADINVSTRPSKSAENQPTLRPGESTPSSETAIVGHRLDDVESTIGSSQPTTGEDTASVTSEFVGDAAFTKAAPERRKILAPRSQEQQLAESETAHARQSPDNTKTSARAPLRQPELTFGQAIGSPTRSRPGEASGDSGRGQRQSSEYELAERGLEEPARTVAKSDVLPLVDDGHNSANADDPALINPERKNPPMDDPLSSKIFSAGPTVGREDAHGRADMPPTTWRPAIERLAEDMVSRLRVGQRDAVIQLDPPELGKIRIDLRMEGDKLHARIVTEAHGAQSLLENHLPELRQALQANQVDLADVRVWHGSGNGAGGELSQGFQQTPQGRQQGDWHGNGAASHGVIVADAPSHELSSSETGRVSVWV